MFKKQQEAIVSRVEDREINMCRGPCRPLTRINLNEVEWKSYHLTSVLLILDQRGKGGSRKEDIAIIQVRGDHGSD